MMMNSMPKGVFPVVDQQGKLEVIISTCDLIRAFINVCGMDILRILLCVEVEDKRGQMKKIVDAITEEKVAFGSILVARHWWEGKRAVFPYLLTSNVTKVKRKLEGMGICCSIPRSGLSTSFQRLKKVKLRNEKTYWNGSMRLVVLFI